MRATNQAVLVVMLASGSSMTPEIVGAGDNWTAEQLEVIEATNACWLAES